MSMGKKREEFDLKIIKNGPKYHFLKCKILTSPDIVTFSEQSFKVKFKERTILIKNSKIPLRKILAISSYSIRAFIFYLYLCNDSNPKMSLYKTNLGRPCHFKN